MSNIEGSDQTDVWHVQLPTGEVRAGTLEQLDAAFQAGAISADTMVLGPGQTAWATLGDVAGIEEPEAAPAAPVAPASIPAPAVPTTMRPVVSDVGDFDLDAMALQPPNKKRGLVIAIAAVVLLGGGAAAVTSGDGPPAPAAAAANTQAPPPPAPPPPPKPVATAPPAPAAPTLTDAQRKALLEADKARDARIKAKFQAGSSSSPRRSSASSNPFNSGGNPNDPLNSKL